MEVLWIQKLDKDAVEPKRQHAEDAGLDLCSCETVEIPAGSWRLVKTGIAVEIPHKHVGYVCSRSGLAAKHGVFVLNAPGVVDCGYRGEVCVILMNAGKDSYTVMAGARIAQLIVQRIELPDVCETNELTKTDRGTGGFGSTGA